MLALVILAITWITVGLFLNISAWLFLVIWALISGITLAWLNGYQLFTLRAN